ncbi:MAG: AAA family ATPase [Alphaproteobacteria bacterium]
MLIIFGGLPGTGKTTLARLLAGKLGAVYLRIDTIEYAIAPAEDIAIGEEGYRVAYAVAEDNLRLGLTVVADSVNAIEITRAAWRAVGERAQVKTIEVEIKCSDRAEQRRRVEARAQTDDVSGIMASAWAKVENRKIEPWNAKVVIDTAHRSVEDCLAELQEAVRRA